MLLGLIGLLVAYGVGTGLLPGGVGPAPQPKGLLVPIPTFKVVACLLPLLLLGSIGLLFVGSKRILDP